MSCPDISETSRVHILIGLVGPAGTGPVKKYGNRLVWNTLSPVQSPYDAHVGVARGPCGVLWFIW